MKYSSIAAALVILSGGFAFSQSESFIVIEPGDELAGVYVDDVVQKTIMNDNRVLEYESVREADVPWQRRIWRVIDVREKLNLPFSYPEQPFFSILAEGALSGNIAVFRDENFTEMFTTDEVQRQLRSSDTVYVTDPITYEREVQVVENEINPADIKRFRIKEMWYFNKQTSRMQVRILGIAPIREYFDEDTGIFKYEAPLFWIYLPEARHVLARYPVFNEVNDVSVMSWADLFDLRKFSSYIYKQSNIHDVRLKDIYPDGIDRLYESEKIKSELFNWEHDLWTY